MNVIMCMYTHARACHGFQPNQTRSTVFNAVMMMLTATAMTAANIKDRIVEHCHCIGSALVMKAHRYILNDVCFRMRYADLTYKYAVIADLNLMSKFLMSGEKLTERHRLSRLFKIFDMTAVLIKSHVKFASS